MPYCSFFQLFFKNAIRIVQENQMGKKLNWIHQLQVYGNDTNLLGDKHRENYVH
jgi:hypothetical protein